jgi:hypothetical protein
MIPDNTKELTEGEFKHKCLKAQCPILPVKPYTPDANHAEGDIRELKHLFRRQMEGKHVHEAFLGLVFSVLCPSQVVDLPQY